MRHDCQTPSPHDRRQGAHTRGPNTSPAAIALVVNHDRGAVTPQSIEAAAQLMVAEKAAGRARQARIVLVHGDAPGVLSSVAASSIDRPAIGLWWPAGRAWFVATEIEFEWAFVAGEQLLMKSVRDDERLEVAPTAFNAPAYRAAELSGDRRAVIAGEVV